MSKRKKVILMGAGGWDYHNFNCVYRDDLAYEVVAFEQVRAPDLDGAAATEENILNKSYKLVRPFLFVSRGEPVGHAKDFIDFVLSDEGQALIKKKGLLTVR